jgi:hypothetical protein
MELETSPFYCGNYWILYDDVQGKALKGDRTPP